MNCRQAHHRSYLITVAIQLIEGGEAPRLQVGCHTVDHFVEIAHGNVVAGDGIVEGGQHGVRLIAARERFAERGAPLLDTAPGRAGLIAQIVAIAHEGIHRAHSIALFAGEQHEGIIEISSARTGHAAAPGVRFFEGGHHAARVRATRASEPSNSQTRSAFEIAGRRDSTS